MALREIFVERGVRASKAAATHLKGAPPRSIASPALRCTVAMAVSVEIAASHSTPASCCCSNAPEGTTCSASHVEAELNATAKPRIARDKYLTRAGAGGQHEIREFFEMDAAQRAPADIRIFSNS